MQPEFSRFFRVNQRHWDQVVPIHTRSAFYDVEGFKAGKSSLHDLELRELGDVAGKSMLHLQCHFGLDSLSWARLGAKVTGMDFSSKAIEVARSLNAELGLDAAFVQANVYSLPKVLAGQFDIVFTTYVVLIWLPDLERWAQLAARMLKPGGTFYLADEHPFTLLLNEEDGTVVRRAGGLYWAGSEPLHSGPDTDYADPTAPVTTSSYEWTHGLGEVVSALANAGLTIRWLREHPVCAWQRYSSMTQGPDGWWRLPPPYDKTPLTFSLLAVR